MAALARIAVRGPLLAVASGLLTALALPGMGGPGALAYAALAPLLWVTVEATGGHAFALGWLAGTVAFFASMAWVADTVHTYGALPYWIAYPVALLNALYLGAYTGVFAWVSRFLFARRVPLVLAAPLVWVALEYARAHLVTGDPWNLLGLALADSTRIVQLADITGVYGVSGFIVVINVCLFTLVAPLFGRYPGRRQSFFLNHALLLFLVPICVVTYGQVRIASLGLDHQRHPNPEGPIRVSLVQPNIPQAQKWDPAFLEETIQRLERLTRAAAPHRPEMVVWPEASAPLVLEEDPMLSGRVAALAKGLGSHLVVGTLSPAEGGAARNAVTLFDPQGRAVAQVAKTHLVPFGEYVPLERYLPFVRALTAGIGNVLPGAEPVVLPHPRGAAAVAVCYEIIFPDLVRRRMAGAAFIVTITNDAWFGASAALAQHFAQARMRAVENRAYVVRAANTGITGMIDPYGIVQAAAEPNTEALVNVAIDRAFAPGFYATHGDVFARASVILVFLISTFAAFRRAKRPRQREEDDSDG